jgi:hypothetical protein
MEDRPSTAWRDALDISEPPKDITRHNPGVARIQDLQRVCQHYIGRSFHEKQLLGALGELVVRSDLPDFCKRGPFAEGGARYAAAIRLSNAQGCPRADLWPDIRGAAVKFFYAGAEVDLLLTNTPASVTPDADQFMEFGQAYAEGAGHWTPIHTLKLLAGVLRRQGLRRAVPNLWRIFLAIVLPVRSAAAEKYWGSAVRFGDYVARYTLQPAAKGRSYWVNPFNPDYLRAELKKRLESGGLHFRLGLQFFVSRQRTPLHAAHSKWRAPVYWVADLTVPKGSMTGPGADEIARDVNRMPFDPTRWFDGVVTDFLASRGEAYRASHRRRGASQLPDYLHYFQPASRPAGAPQT